MKPNQVANHPSSVESSSVPKWKTRRGKLRLDAPVLMGILNVTPDSFSDGGRLDGVEAAVTRALELESDGASIVDIGGESTRPGAEAVGIEEELHRTVPVVRELRKRSEVLISIDTSKAEVAEAAISAGADIVNDVTGLTGDPWMVSLCVETSVGVLAMHMQGNPRTMQINPDYTDQDGVVAAVDGFFAQTMDFLTSAGVDAESVCLDPGIGFGKTFEDNLSLLENLSGLQKQRPLLLGVSRKSFLGLLAEEGDAARDEPQARDELTAVITLQAIAQGVMLHRVHNVELVRAAIEGS